MIPAWALRLVLALSAACALIGSAPVVAQTRPAGDPLRVCLLRDNGHADPARLIREPRRFDCTSQQHRLGPGDFWAISQYIGRRSSSETPLNVRTASLWQDGVTLHILYADGTIRRIATVEEIAGWYVFLASDAARYATGIVIPVDGGLDAQQMGLRPITASERG